MVKYSRDIIRYNKPLKSASPMPTMMIDIGRTDACTERTQHSYFYLARAACMPGGLYVLLALISIILMIAWAKLSGSTEPIFTKFSPYGRYFIVDYRFDPIFSIAQGTLPSQPILGYTGTIGPFTFIHSPGIPKRIARLPSLFKHFISDDIIWLHCSSIWWTFVQQLLSLIYAKM